MNILSSILLNRSHPGKFRTGPSFPTGATGSDVFESGRMKPSLEAQLRQTALRRPPQTPLDKLIHGTWDPIPEGNFVFFGATGDLVSKRAVRNSLAELAEDDELAAGRHRLIMTSRRPVDGEGYLRDFYLGDRHSKPISPAGLKNLAELSGLNQPGAQLATVRLVTKTISAGSRSVWVEKERFFTVRFHRASMESCWSR